MLTLKVWYFNFNGIVFLLYWYGMLTLKVWYFNLNGMVFLF